MRYIKLLLGAFFLALPPSASPAVPPDANVLLITVDTLRYDRIGFLSDKYVRTPNIDALARRSAVFTRAYAQATLTRLLDWAARQGVERAYARCYAAEGELAYAPVAALLRARPLPTLDDVWLAEKLAVQVGLLVIYDMLKAVAKKGGFRVKEVPITFVDRKMGKTKLRSSQIFDWAAFAMRNLFSPKPSIPCGPSQMSFVSQKSSILIVTDTSPIISTTMYALSSTSPDLSDQAESMCLVRSTE